MAARIALARRKGKRLQETVPIIRLLGGVRAPINLCDILLRIMACPAPFTATYQSYARGGGINRSGIDIVREKFSASSLTIAACLCMTMPAGVLAQDVDADPAPEAGSPAPQVEDDTILVFGARLIDSIESPQPPLLELDPQDIAAYGVGSIGELLDALGPSVTSNRGRGGGGRPIVLVNGIRVASFRDIRSYPPEAIDKVEVFSEETAQQYGYRPDQRIVNFILKDNYSSREIELGYGQPFDGGFSNHEIEGTYLRIDGGRRLNIQLVWEGSTGLTEAERGVVQSGAQPILPSDPDQANFRTLRAPQDEYKATLNWSTPLGKDGSTLSLNGTFEREDTKRLQGIDSVTLTDPDGNDLVRSFNAANPLTIVGQQDEYALGASVTTNQSGWRITGTLDASRSENASIRARRADTSGLIADAAAGTLALDASLDGLVDEVGFDFADTQTDSISSLVTARGLTFVLPAGDVSLTLDAGYNWNRIESADTRNPGALTQLTRGDVNGGAALTIPLTQRGGFGGAIGEFSLNASAGVDHLSDFGTLYDWTLGLTWGLTDSLSLNANRFVREAAPGLGQLGNPEIATENVPIFDIVNGETVLATVIDGGNPNLPAQEQRDWKFGLNWELPFMDQGRLNVDYIRNTTNDLSSGFPVLTPEIEAAFPGRVLRDATGRLIQLDDRPVSFAEQFLERIEVSLNMRGQFGENAGGRGPGGRFGGRGGGGRGEGGRGGGAPSAGVSDGPPPQARGERGGGSREGRDPARMAQMRATFCETPEAELRMRLTAAIAAAANGEEPPPGSDGEPLRIPPRMLERLRSDDGTLDQERFAAMRERICSGDGPPATPPAGTAPQSAPQSEPQSRPANGFAAAAAARGGRPSGNSGRWFANITYRLELDNTVLIAPGIAPLDLLDGDAIGSTGQPRHSVRLRSGIFYGGFGGFVFARYTGQSTLDGSGLPGSTDLDFGDFVTFNMRAFVDFNQQEKLVEKIPILDDARFIIRVDNVFDARQRVTDSNGIVPVRFQPFLLDPVGRRFEVELRKLF